MSVRKVLPWWFPEDQGIESFHLFSTRSMIGIFRCSSTIWKSSTHLFARFKLILKRASLHTLINTQTQAKPKMYLDHELYRHLVNNLKKLQNLHLLR